MIAEEISDESEQQWKEKVVQIRRVTKVVKGGKRMSFRALVVVGDLKGRVGVGLGKSSEVSPAIRKAVEYAKKNIISVPMVATTIPHDITGKMGASCVILRPATAGTGVIAGGAVRTILELSGIKDIVAKSIGSSNAVNVSSATLAALKCLKNLDVERNVRGKDIDVKFVS